MSQYGSVLVGMEACGSSQYWARELVKQGHEVRLIAPHHVKPFAQRAKNDRNDAAAICEVLRRPCTRFVAIKSAEQQELGALLSVRERYVTNRTALCNQLRGLLSEKGIVFATSLAALRRGLREGLDEKHWHLSSTEQCLYQTMWEELMELDVRIRALDGTLQQTSQSHPTCNRLRSIPGVGPISAVALFAHLGNGQNIRNGRHLAAYLGLVPRQHSSGERLRLGRITKRGDSRLRQLLVHGARAVLRIAHRYPNNATLQWGLSLRQKKGYNKAAVALANKTARVVWHLLREPNSRYQAPPLSA